MRSLVIGINIFLICFLLYSCNTNQKSNGTEFVFCRMKLSQGDYLTRPGDFSKEELLNLSHVLIHYNVPFELNLKKEVIVDQPDIDTNYWYNVYVKSQDSVWLNTHPLRDKW